MVALWCMVLVMSIVRVGIVLFLPRNLYQLLRSIAIQFTQTGTIIGFTHQCTKTIYKNIQVIHNSEMVKAMPFLAEMNLAYAAADLVISRAGALSISEIAVADKASILIPSISAGTRCRRDRGRARQYLARAPAQARG